MRKTILFFLTILAAIQLNAAPHSKLRTQNSELKVEPSFWWTNMKNPELQIMLYGKDISKSEVSINYPGVSILEKKLTDNPNYIFLYININENAKAGIFNIELKNGKKKKTVKYELKERTPNSANRVSFSEKDNVYLIMPDSFANCNPLNDSVK